MDAVELAHLVRPQRRRGDPEQQSGAGVEQGQDRGHGEAAAGGLAAGLAEVPLEFGLIGHGERRAVDQEGAVPLPAAFGLGGRDQRPDHAAQDRLQDRQGEPGAGLAVGGVGEGAAGQQADVGQRGIAVEDLHEQPMDDGVGGEQAVPPGVSELAADLPDGTFIEVVGEVLPKPTQRVINTAMHPGVSCLMGRVTTP